MPCCLLSLAVSIDNAHTGLDGVYHTQGKDERIILEKGLICASKLVRLQAGNLTVNVPPPNAVYK